MASTIKSDFSLCETVAGVLRTVSEAYGMDGFFLVWQYEKYILVGGSAPFRMSTGEYPGELRDGIDKVSFEVDFEKENPNIIKYIRFDELPSKGKYIVTQTSMRHLQDGGNCNLWIEIPKGAERDSNSSIQSLRKAEICCAEWRDHLPSSPETALERVLLIDAQDNMDWLKTQVAFKDSANVRLSSSLAFSRIEIAALKTQISRLEADVSKTEFLKQRIDELKTEINAEHRAKDAAIAELEAKVKSLNTNVEKQQVSIKGKTDIIAKLRRELKAKSTVEENSGSESSTPTTAKRRKTATLKTPKGKSQPTMKVPNTAPDLYGRSSTLGRTPRFYNAAFTLGDNVATATALPCPPSSQNGTFTPGGTVGDARTPLPSGSRSQNAASTLRDPIGRTRGAAMAAVSAAQTPTFETRSRVSSVSSLSSLSEADEKVFD